MYVSTGGMQQSSMDIKQNKNQNQLTFQMAGKLHTHTPPVMPSHHPCPKKAGKPCLCIMCLITSLPYRDPLEWRIKIYLLGKFYFVPMHPSNTENTKVPPKQCCLLFSRILKGTRIMLRSDLEKETHWFVNAKNLTEEGVFLKIDNFQSFRL